MRPKTRARTSAKHVTVFIALKSAPTINTKTKLTSVHLRRISPGISNIDPARSETIIVAEHRLFLFGSASSSCLGVEVSLEDSVLIVAPERHLFFSWTCWSCHFRLSFPTDSLEGIVTELCFSIVDFGRMIRDSALQLINTDESYHLYSSPGHTLPHDIDVSFSATVLPLIANTLTKTPCGQWESISWACTRRRLPSSSYALSSINNSHHHHMTQIMPPPESPSRIGVQTRQNPIKLRTLNDGSRNIGNRLVFSCVQFSNSGWMVHGQKI